MPYGSNDGYGRQQLRDRPSTTLTDVGRRHMSGSSMSSLLSQGDVVQRGPSPTRHTAPGHAPPDCRSPSLYPSTEEGVHAPVQLPHGASRQDLLSALEQANATIRQLRLELRAATRCGSAHDMGLQCEQLEAEQRELVRAFDDLSRVNGNLRRQLKQQARPHPSHSACLAVRSPRGHSPAQAGETELLREALLRAERDWQQRAAGAAQTAQASQHSEDTVATRLTRTLSRPLGKPLARLSKLASPDRHRQLHSAASRLPTASSPARTSCEHYVDEAAV